MTRPWEQQGFAFLDSSAQRDRVTIEAEALGRDAATAYYCHVAGERTARILGREAGEPVSEPVWRVAVIECRAAYATAWWTRWWELCEVDDVELPDDDGDLIPWGRGVGGSR